MSDVLLAVEDRNQGNEYLKLKSETLLSCLFWTIIISCREHLCCENYLKGEAGRMRCDCLRI